MPTFNNSRLTGESNTQVQSSERMIDALHIQIWTSDVGGGGTNARVYLSLNGNSHELDTEDYNDFERGDIDTYIIHETMSLADLRQSNITLYHDNSGRKSGWHVGQVRLYVLFHNSKYAVLYKRWDGIGWLANDEPGAELGINLQYGDEIRSRAIRQRSNTILNAIT